MKHILLALLILFFSSTAFAFWRADARVTVQPTVVTSAVYNNTAQPMYCWGRVYGETHFGNILHNYSEGFVNPGGGWGYIYVNTTNSDPFVQGWASVNCRWAN